MASEVYFVDYERIPERVPRHWNASGQPNDFTTRERAIYYLLISPGLMLLMLLLTLVLPWLSPRQFELDRNSPTYGYIVFTVVALGGYLHAVIRRPCRAIGEAVGVVDLLQEFDLPRIDLSDPHAIADGVRRGGRGGGGVTHSVGRPVTAVVSALAVHRGRCVSSRLARE